MRYKLAMIFLILFSLSTYASEFQGQVSLSNCTGFVFKTQETLLSDKARVATNGHCLQSLFGMILKPGQTKRNEKASRSMTLYTNAGRTYKTKSESLAFATMTGTDLAIYELSETYNDLAARDIYPLTISRELPYLGQEVMTISKRKKSKFSCRIAHITQTSEGGYDFSDALRMSEECRQINGTSGSPVMDTRTGEVVGIANSFNKNGKRCGNNNPCERNGEQTIVVHRARYAQQIIPYVQLDSE